MKGYKVNNFTTFFYAQRNTSASDTFTLNNITSLNRLQDQVLYIPSTSYLLCKVVINKTMSSSLVSVSPMDIFTCIYSKINKRKYLQIPVNIEAYIEGCRFQGSFLLVNFTSFTGCSTVLQDIDRDLQHLYNNVKTNKNSRLLTQVFYFPG